MKSVFNCIIAFALLTTSSGFAGSPKTWCKDISQSLYLARQTGYASSSYADEKTILLAAINTALAVAKPKKHKFFIETLTAAKTDHLIYQDEPRQVHLLRKYIDFAIDDFNYIDAIWYKNESDNGEYIVRMARRALDIGVTSPLESEELSILSTAAARGVAMFDVSDSLRTSSYSCSREILQNAIDLVAANPTLDIETQLNAFRSALRQVIHNVGCR